jgi:NAD(P)-dependent dehydrogenase (short-subunit alcohol dehydrogenase family)
VNTLAGKAAVVTGAGRNIGLDIATRLAGEGAQVVVVDRDQDLASSAAQQLCTAYGSSAAIPFVCDVTEEREVEAMAKAGVEAFGHLDILVNNVAATDRGATVLDLELAEWRRILDICVTSMFLCSKHVGRAMVDGGKGGAIVNIGSTSGYYGRSNALAYPTAKSALIGFTRSLAIQLGPHGIRVNLIAPNKAGSPVGQSEFNPSRVVKNLVGRPADPSDIGKIVAFMVSDAAGFVTGTDLLADGGATLVGAGQ